MTLPAPKRGGQTLSASQEWNPVLEAAKVTQNTVGGRGIRVSTTGLNRQILTDPISHGMYPAVEALVLNTGSTILEPFRPVKLVNQLYDTKAVGTYTALDRNQKSNVVFEGRRPLAGDAVGMWGIMKTDARPSHMGICWICGSVPAYIEATDSGTSIGSVEIDTTGAVDDALVWNINGTGGTVWPAQAVVAGTQYMATVFLPCGGSAEGDEIDIWITSSTPTGLPGQWKYTAEQIKKSAQGYGAWASVPGGWSGNAYNKTEEVAGNTIACPSGLPRRAKLYQATDGYTVDIEAWFEYEWCCEIECEECTNCTPCTGGGIPSCRDGTTCTPCLVQVVFAGISICPGWTIVSGINGTFSSVRQATGPVPSVGMVRVPYWPNPCWWFQANAGMIKNNGTGNIMPVDLHVWRSAPTAWQVYLHTYGPGLNVFAGFALTSDCNPSGLVISNVYPGTGCGPSVQGWGGTGTLTACI